MESHLSPRPVNVGMIGCGDRLRTVVQAILHEAPANRIRVAAVYDPDPISREALCREIGQGFTTCDTEEALIADPSIDWVFIGSWNCHHARQALLALNAGKHVFCEKPLATSFEDCLAIQEAARKSGKIFAFGLVLRYSPHYQKIKEVLESGAIGKIVSFEFNETLGFNHGGYIFGNWRRDRANAGTHLLEKCCHDLDLANWMVGSLPVRVASFGGRDFFKPENARHVKRIGPDKDGTAAYASWPFPQPHRFDPFDGTATIFDNQVAILQYANGVRGTFHTNCNCAITERRFYLCGTEGTLRADLYTGLVEVQRIGWNTPVEKIDTQVMGGHGGGDECMGASMAETLLKGKAPLASVNEGIHSAFVAFGIDQAADEGRLVDLTSAWQRAGIDPSGV